MSQSGWFPVPFGSTSPEVISLCFIIMWTRCWWSSMAQAATPAVGTWPAWDPNENWVEIRVFEDEAVPEEVRSKIWKGWEKNRWPCLWILLLNVAWKNNKQLWGLQRCKRALTAYNGLDLAWALEGWKEQPCVLVLMAVTPSRFWRWDKYAEFIQRQLW